MAKSTHSAIVDPRNENVKIYINGEFHSRENAQISVFDSGFLVGDGIWEGLRLHNGKFAFLDKVLTRLIFCFCPPDKFVPPGPNKSSLLDSL